jgi:hypothetical protein
MNNKIEISTEGIRFSNIFGLTSIEKSRQTCVTDLFQERDYPRTAEPEPSDRFIFHYRHSVYTNESGIRNVTGKYRRGRVKRNSSRRSIRTVVPVSETSWSRRNSGPCSC